MKEIIFNIGDDLHVELPQYSPRRGGGFYRVEQNRFIRGKIRAFGWSFGHQTMKVSDDYTGTIVSVRVESVRDALSGADYSNQRPFSAN
jgi:hypothetical protein